MARAANIAWWYAVAVGWQVFLWTKLNDWLFAPLIIMLPSQEHQRPSKKNGIKSSIRALFSPNSRSRNSRAHDSLPNASVDVITTSSSRQTSIFPANVSDTDLILRPYSASTPQSALGHRGPGSKRINDTWFMSNTSFPSVLAISTPTDSRSPTIQAAGNVTSYASPQMVDNIGLGE